MDNLQTTVEKRKGVCIGKARKKSSAGVIPVFFAIDQNYLPFLAVTLQSITDNISKDNNYRMYILHENIPAESMQRILKYNAKNVSIEFVDVGERIQGILDKLQLRDYYTNAIYYRLFIADMFPEYDKAIYLDSDTVVLADIAKLFGIDIAGNFLGATADQAVQIVDPFKVYVDKVLGLHYTKYINSGVIIMNLKKFRDEKFGEQFKDILNKYRFKVAPDQDLLNVICKDKITYLSPLWDAMPIAGKKPETPKLIHYNFTSKPWHYKGVLYEEHFWEYARKTEYYGEILDILNNVTPEMVENDKACEQGLIDLCLKEAEKEDNYYNLYCKN